MGRRKKQQIIIQDNNSLQGVMQEVYNNACSQINDAQKVINELGASVTITEETDVDDLTKLAKAKTDVLKVKDSAIKIKLDLGKLQNDIIKHGGNLTKAINSNSEVVESDAFDKIRELIEAKKN